MNNEQTVEGFRVANLFTGNSYNPGSSACNHLLMLVEGSLRVSCNEFSGRVVGTNKCILLPINADIRCTALSPCRLVCFSFYTLPDMYKGNYMDTLRQTAGQTAYAFEPLPLREPMQNFLRLIASYHEQGLDGPVIQNIKYREFFILLQLFYTPQEVAALLHPIVGRNESRNLALLSFLN